LDKLRCVAIDDQPLDLEIIKFISNKVASIEMVAYYTDPLEAISHVIDDNIGLVFLDFNMGKISALDIIKLLPPAVMVIIVSAERLHELEALKMDVVDIVIKPYNLEGFVRAVSKALYRIS